MKTADDILRKNLIKYIEKEKISSKDRELCIIESMIEFAKFHVQLALKEASENVEILQYSNMAKINKDSILNAYPLTNII
jgi:hypothetical protein